MEWKRFYNTHRAQVGDSWWDEKGGTFYDVYDVRSGNLVGTFEDDIELAIRHAEELYKTEMELIEKILIEGT